MMYPVLSCLEQVCVLTNLFLFAGSNQTHGTSFSGKRKVTEVSICTALRRDLFDPENETAQNLSKVGTNFVCMLHDTRAARAWRLHATLWLGHVQSRCHN